MAATSFACLGASAPDALAEQSGTSQTVLILNSYDESSTPFAQTSRAFALELSQRIETPIAFRQFDVDQRGTPAPASEDAKVNLLRSQFGTHRPALIVALGPPAVDFWLTHRDALLPEVPLAAAAADAALDRARFRPGDAVVASRFSYVPLFEDMMRLLPGTRHVLVVFGASPHERALSRAAEAQLAAAFGDDLDLEFTNDMTVHEVQQRLTRLTPGSAVFVGILDSDANGVLMHQYSGLTLVREASPVPVFGPFVEQVGRGIIGGRLIPLEEIGRMLAAEAAEILRGRRSEIAWKVSDVSEPVYDGRELDAWGISRAKLPEGSTVRFEPPTLWGRYATWILLTAVVFALLLALIASLLLQMRRRRAAERINADLGSRLITAHEDERRLIARELHDDLSQRLARLAIDASFLTARPDSDAAKEALHGLQPELVRISKDVHDLSYRLHPSLLEDLGLAEALRAECARMRRHTRAEIVVRAEDFDAELPRDILLCIYRIGQEALQNAVKYADADRIEVTLEKSDGALALTVCDDGTGFDATGKPGNSGLGLSSMRERARLAGGSLEIRSRPGQGATVRVAVPLKAKPT